MFPAVVIHIVLNEFQNDGRVLRAARCAAECGAEAHVFALKSREASSRECIEGVQVTRFPMWTRPLGRRLPALAAKYAEAGCRMVRTGRAIKPTIVHAHNVSALPIGYALSRLTGARLVYDAHELWSDSADVISSSKLYKAGKTWFERTLAARCDATITVCNGIAASMSRDLSIPVPLVIRNVPELGSESGAFDRNPGRLRHALGLQATVPLILYQGNLSSGRGLLPLVRAMSLMQEKSAVLVLLGDGPLRPQLLAEAKAEHVENRVIHHPAVAHNELAAWTKDADIGVCAIEPICRSYYFALPNKLFEFIHAGLPVLVSDLPELRSIVEQYGVGRIARSCSAEDLAAALDAMLASDEGLQKFSLAANAAARVLNWQEESVELKRCYARLAASPLLSAGAS